MYQCIPPLLLKLSEKVQRTENVRWIKLARRNDHLPHDCMVCGWGHSKEKRSMASELREVNVTLVVSSSCAEHKTYCSVGDIGPYFVSENLKKSPFLYAWQRKTQNQMCELVCYV